MIWGAQTPNKNGAKHSLLSKILGGPPAEIFNPLTWHWSWPLLLRFLKAHKNWCQSEIGYPQWIFAKNLMVTLDFWNNEKNNVKIHDSGSDLQVIKNVKKWIFSKSSELMFLNSLIISDCSEIKISYPKMISKPWKDHIFEILKNWDFEPKLF